MAEFVAIDPSEKYFFYYETGKTTLDPFIPIVIFGPDGKQIYGSESAIRYQASRGADNPRERVWFLKGAERVIISGALVDYKNRLVIRHDGVYGFTTLPDGKFIQETYHPQISSYGYALFNKDGNFMSALSMAQIHQLYDKDPDAPNSLFPNGENENQDIDPAFRVNNQLVGYLDRILVYSKKEYDGPVSSPIYTNFGWIVSTSNDIGWLRKFDPHTGVISGQEYCPEHGSSRTAYAYDHYGRVISTISLNEKAMFNKLKEMVPDLKSLNCLFNYGYWNERGDFYFEYRTADGEEIWKLPWIDGGNKIIYAPKTLWRDHEGRLLWTRPIRKLPTFELRRDGVKPQEHDIPLKATMLVDPDQRPPFPVNDLCEFNWAKYRLAKPAGKGSIWNISDQGLPQEIREANEGLFSVDLNHYPQLDIINESRGIYDCKNGWTKKKINYANKIHLENAEEFGKCGIARIDVPGVTSREKPFAPGDLDPSKPDYIEFAYDTHDDEGSGQPPDTGISLIETGPNTKIFIMQKMQLNLWLRDDLSPDKRSAITAYARQWSTDKDYTAELLESAPGSRKFISADGKVTYELAYIYDHRYKLAQAPASTEVNSLYFYITDENLNLSRLPFIAKETDPATNEYRAGAYTWYTQLKSWAQVHQDLKESQFHIEVDGDIPDNERSLEISWTDGLGNKMIATDHLIEIEKGKYKTETPLIAFSKQGCDVEGRLYRESYSVERPSRTSVYDDDYDCAEGRTAKISTPHVPGTLPIRYTQGLEIHVGKYHALLRNIDNVNRIDRCEIPSEIPYVNPLNYPTPPWKKWAVGLLIAGSFLIAVKIISRKKSI